MEKVRLGIIGIGAQGTTYAGLIFQGMVPHMELGAICDISREAYETGADRIVANASMMARFTGASAEAAVSACSGRFCVSGGIPSAATGHFWTVQAALCGKSPASSGGKGRKEDGNVESLAGLPPVQRGLPVLLHP